MSHDDPVVAMAVGPGHILVGSSDAKLYLWDKVSCTKLKTLRRHKNAVRCVHLRYPRALSGSKDKTALLWDLEEGERVVSAKIRQTA